MANKKPVVTYLYSEVMSYAIAVMRELVDTFGAEVHCVHWDKKKGTPFIPQNEKGITFYGRSNYDKASLIALIEKQAPDIIYVSGTMDKTYLQAALHFRAKGVKLVGASDNKWLKTWKQRIQITFSNYFFRRYFEYTWIPGTRQYVFARLMGFEENKIIKNLYSANTGIFQKAYENNLEAKRQKYPHTIVYVGRFSPEKGVDIIYNAFLEAKKETNNDWKLIMVGGQPSEQYKESDSVQIIPFLPNAELPGHTKDFGVFCVPSYREQWGVVIHEFTAAGIPMLIADCAGAIEAFLVNGYNGFTFDTGSVQDLKKKILLMMAKSDEELYTMGQRSNGLSQSINPVISAYSLMSVLYN